MLRHLIIAFVNCLLAIAAYSQPGKPQSFTLDPGLRFEENKGQVADMNSVVQSNSQGMVVSR